MVASHRAHGHGNATAGLAAAGGSALANGPENGVFDHGCGGKSPGSIHPSSISEAERASGEHLKALLGFLDERAGAKDTLAVEFLGRARPTRIPGRASDVIGA